MRDSYVFLLITRACTIVSLRFSIDMDNIRPETCIFISIF